MSKATVRRSTQSVLVGLIVVTALFVAMEWWITNTAAFKSGPGVMAVAVTVDLIVGLPLLFWVALVRTGRAPATLLMPVALLSILLTRFIVPAGDQELLRWIERAAFLVEMALLAFAAVKVRQIIRHYRALRPSSIYASDALRGALSSVLGDSALVSILTTEFSLVNYVFTGWGRTYQPVSSDHHVFAYHQRTTYSLFLAVLLLLSPLELIAVHLLLSNLIGPTVAWVVTLLSIYSIVWLIGDFQAVRLHPIVATETSLHLRTGMRWEGSIPWASIKGVRAFSRDDAADKAQYVDLSLMASPKLLLELDAPVEFQGMFNRKQHATRIGIAVDEPDAFLEVVRGYIPPSGELT